MKDFIKLCVGFVVMLGVVLIVASAIKHTARAFHRYNHHQELYGNA